MRPLIILRYNWVGTQAHALTISLMVLRIKVILKNFEITLCKAKDFLDKSADQKLLITVNSWNKWTEKNYIMTRTIYG